MRTESYNDKFHTTRNEEELILKELINEDTKEKDLLEREENNITDMNYESEYKCSFKSILKYPKVLNSFSECFCVRFEKFDSLLAAGYSNGYIVVYNTETMEYHRYMNNTDYPITCLRWKPHSELKPKNILIATSSDGKITHWHTASGKPLHVMEEKENPVMCIDFNQEGSSFATAGNDRIVRIYDDDMKIVVSTMKPGGLRHPGHANRIFSVCFHKGVPNLLASGGWDNTVQFYDIRSSSVSNSIYGPHICGDSLDFKGYELLTGSWATENQIQIWDIRTFKLIRTVEWDKEESSVMSTYVYSSQFSKDKISNLISVGCSNNNIVRIFDEDNDDIPIMTTDNLSKACYSVDFSNNGKYLAFGCGDGNIRVVTISKQM